MIRRLGGYDFINENLWAQATQAEENGLGVSLNAGAVFVRSILIASS